MDHALLIAAAQTHGPPHSLVLGVLVVGIVGWLVYRGVTGRKSSDGDSLSDRGAASTHRAPDPPESDRGPGL